MLLVSHDRALLDLVDQVADLRDGRLRWYGGNLTAYEEAVAAEQEAARRLVHTAGADVRRQQRELRDARIKLDRRRRYGQKMWDTKREPKIIMGARKRQAEVAAGKHRGMHLEKLEESRQRLTEAEEAVHDDDEIRVDLPGTEVPAGRTVLELRGVRLRGGALADLELRGQRADQPVGTLSGGERFRAPLPPCCWPSHHPSCCSWTSRPTISTWPVPASSLGPSPPTDPP